MPWGAFVLLFSNQKYFWRGFLILLETKFKMTLLTAVAANAATTPSTTFFAFQINDVLYPINKQCVR